MWKVVSLGVALCAFAIAIQAQDFCIQCAQSVENLACIDPDADMFNLRCPDSPPSNGSCFSRVNDEGNVIRGCLGSLDNATRHECDSETCRVCIAISGPSQPAGCNTGVFPDGRLRCHICAGDGNSTCAGVVNTTMSICPLHVNDDQCYIARPDGNFERGCLSSAPQRCRDEACHLCRGDGCNLIDFSSAVNIHSGAKMFAFALISVAFAMLNK